MLLSVMGAALIAVAICVLLQKTNPEFSMMTALITGILIFLIIILNLTPVLDLLSEWTGEFHLDNVYVMTVIKALGICYLTQLAADTCRDAGYGAIAGKVELAGKVTILVLALPLFSNLLELIRDLVTLGGGGGS